MAAFMGLGAAVGGIANFAGSLVEADAAKDAQAQTAEQIEAAKLAANQAAGSSMSRLGGAIPGALTNMETGFTQGTDLAAQGYGQQRADLLQSGALGVDAITQGQGGALSSLYGGLQAGGDILTNRQDRSGQMLDQQGGLYGNYQADPGYAFRKQEGEDAIRRMQAARGGRFGGAAMKELVDYNQNMASQEFGNYANRANSEFGARSNSDAQGLQAGGQLASLYAQAGQGAANTYMGGAGQMADIYGRTGTQLGGQAAGAGGQLGANTSGYFGSLANLGLDTAKQMNQYELGAAGVGVNMIPTQAANNQSTVPYAGSAINAIGNTVGTLSSIPLLYGASGGFDSGDGAYGGEFEGQPQQPSPYPPR